MAVRSTLISDLFSESKESTLQQKLAAAIIHNNKRLTNTFAIVTEILVEEIIFLVYMLRQEY